MAPTFTQDTRLGKLHTDLGPDVLVLLRFSGTDFVSDLFSYRVEALSTEQNINFDELIGTHACVEINTVADGPRFFDGIVTQAAWSGVGENGNRYSLTLRPWLYVASRRRNQRIFHEMTAPDIIKQVLSAYSGLGQPAIQDKLKGSYETLEYTVQYRESDLNFVCRMMERFGISYHFVHEMQNHTMVLVDAAEELPPIPGDSRKYVGFQGHHQSQVEHFWEWHPERNFTTGAMRLIDYNFKTPDAVMEVDRVGDAQYAEGQIEGYDFPGDYLNEGIGKSVVALRMNQERGADVRHRAVGDCLSLASGMTVVLEGEQVPGVKSAKYVCLSATHSYVSDSYGSGGASSDGHSYTGSYVFSPAVSPLAPERKTGQPTVQGPQTAMVVGEGEIDVDEFGRILVHFHWDLAKANSMRCRVSQNWAHKGWGGMIIPRIGMEVIVDFLEGNPDMPIVTGCVYNGKNMPEYALPANKTRSIFRTDTHEGDGFNELRFEDIAGKEEIFWHAQKDHTTKVLNDSTTRIDHNEVTSVGRNKFSEVVGLDNHQVGGNMNITVTGAVTEVYATGDNKTNWEGIRGLATSLDAEAEEPGDYTLTVAKDITVSAGRDEKTTIARHSAWEIGKDRTTTIGAEHVATVGKSSKNTIGKDYVLTAGDSITLKTGDASIVMKKDGTITIKGKDITIEGTGRIVGKASSSMTLKGSKIDMN